MSNKNSALHEIRKITEAVTKMVSDPAIESAKAFGEAAKAFGEAAKAFAESQKARTEEAKLKRDEIKSKQG